MTTRGSYAHKPIENLSVVFFFFWGGGPGDPKNVSFMQPSQKINGFRQNDSQGF